MSATALHRGQAVPERPAIYARISDDRNEDELGVARQIKQCRQLARRLGWPEPVVFQDNDISAFKRKERKDWDRLAAAIRSGLIDGLLGVHPDRFSRGDLRDLEDLIDLLNGHDVAVMTVNAGHYDLTTASGRMTARIVGSVARAESERMSEKITDKMVELAESGAHHGRTPYGYRKVTRYKDGREIKTLAIVPEEAAVIRQVAERIIDGWPLRRIVKDLNDRGVPAKFGGRWHPPVLRGLVQRPVVIGWRDRYGVLVAKGDWEPILDQATWDRARSVLSDPARKTTRPGRRYLLAGMIYTNTGEPMHGNPRSHTARPVYVGPSVSIDQEATDTEVLRQMWLRLDQMGELPEPTDDLAAAVKADIDDQEAELAKWIALSPGRADRADGVRGLRHPDPGAPGRTPQPTGRATEAEPEGPGRVARRPASPLRERDGPGPAA